jgi:L-rhamnose-H+ transport protein
VATLLGALVVVLAGLVMGSGAWPMKFMRRLQFEHYWFIAMLAGLVVVPWVVTLVFCPNPFAAYHTVAPSLIVKANLFSLAWGVANLLCGLCYVRIGFALTGGILSGLGLSIGMTVPMIVKGSGLFSGTPSLGSAAGRTVMLGAAIMLAGVVLVTLAGFGRDRELKTLRQPAGHFLTGVIMAALAGVLSVGLSFSFVYTQDPIVKAMKAQGAADVPANFAVWAVALLGGALINVLYPAYRLTKNKSWKVLKESWSEGALATLIGLNICFGFALMGKGMLLLGSLGASVGFGIQQSTQMLGSQGVGFISGEWRGVEGRLRMQMYIAIIILITAAIVLAYANTLARV